MLTPKDSELIKSKGIAIKQIEAQVARIKEGMAYSNLIAAATIGNGIKKFKSQELEAFIEYYCSKKDSVDIIKFVPASGAATRMFKFLFQFLKQFNPEKDTIKTFTEKQGGTLLKTFFSNLKKFPFYDEVIVAAKSANANFDELKKEEQYYRFVKAMLSEDVLNYSFYPKGLLPFHKYDDQAITAFEEHLFESTLYATSNQKGNLHFTVSEQHHRYFINELNKVKEKVEKDTKTVFNISFSYQRVATETIALTEQNKLFRKPDGSLFFRPAGHGALLENLNDLNSDIVFIKNIDNITTKEKNIESSRYKKLLGGVLLKTQEQVFAYLIKLDGADVMVNDLKEMVAFLKKELNVSIDTNYNNFGDQEKIVYLKNKLNRPIRVCGMVKNEGEPGGGPFWVKDKAGNVSLQIVEFAQIDFSKKSQQAIVYKATHFNPTDLVCGIKNYKGETFNLLNYVDPEAAFITMKTQNGVDIKVLERPGLWNGSMAHWNSIFVEVPLSTFNPVKTVNDLLKPAHQV